MFCCVREESYKNGKLGGEKGNSTYLVFSKGQHSCVNKY